MIVSGSKTVITRQRCHLSTLYNIPRTFIVHLRELLNVFRVFLSCRHQYCSISTLSSVTRHKGRELEPIQTFVTRHNGSWTSIRGSSTYVLHARKLIPKALTTLYLIKHCLLTLPGPLSTINESRNHHYGRIWAFNGSKQGEKRMECYKIWLKQIWGKSTTLGYYLENNYLHGPTSPGCRMNFRELSCHTSLQVLNLGSGWNFASRKKVTNLRSKYYSSILSM